MNNQLEVGAVYLIDKGVLGTVWKCGESTIQLYIVDLNRAKAKTRVFPIFMVPINFFKEFKFKFLFFREEVQRTINMSKLVLNTGVNCCQLRT